MITRYWKRIAVIVLLSFGLLTACGAPTPQPTVPAQPPSQPGTAYPYPEAYPSGYPNP
ncbi:MAG: hypothetical protein HC911_15320 [Chloroflexaceae bacterium]|nr:hypothetical protein [Chloroflexaceae bacterium]